MKAFLVNLLVALSLILCGFNGYQWYQQAKLNGRIETLGNDIYKKSEDIQELKQSLSVNMDEIKRLEGLRENLGAIMKSNKVELARVQEESDKNKRELAVQTAKAAQVEQYKDAFERANTNIRKQNEIIEGLNGRMKQVAEERNDIVTRHNKLATDYKTLVDDYQKVLGMYTNLVAQVEAANKKNTK